jgi:hypothetical protein
LHRRNHHHKPREWYVDFRPTALSLSPTNIPLLFRTWFLSFRLPLSASQMKIFKSIF